MGQGKEVCPRDCTLEAWTGVMKLEDGSTRPVKNGKRCTKHRRTYNALTLEDKERWVQRGQGFYVNLERSEYDEALDTLMSSNGTGGLLREVLPGWHKQPSGAKRRFDRVYRPYAYWDGGVEGHGVPAPEPAKRPVGRPRYVNSPDSFAVKTTRMELENIAERPVSVFTTKVGRPRKDDLKGRDTRSAFALAVYVLVETGSRRKVLSLALGCGTTTIDTLYHEGRVFRATVPDSSTTRRFVRFSDIAPDVLKASPAREEEGSLP